MSKLAVNGGYPIRTAKFPHYKVINNEELESVSQIIRTGILSKFLGSWQEDFYGGPKIRELESYWSSYFGSKHAIAVNSCTSGLYCAIGAAGIGPGDEVVVSPYTMSASATSIIIFNGVPVFADIENDYFCLDPQDIENKITPRAKAIVVVDIFGLPYNADKINEIAKKHNLIVIEDCAQAPGAKYQNKYAGTLGDIGVYSLNYHKHIHSGEGGIVVTDNDEYAEKIRLIRNHAEAVVENKGAKNLVNMIGFNFRMTEIEAAISIEQLKKLSDLNNIRINNIMYLENKLKDIPFLALPKIRENASHAYYFHAIKFDEKIAGVHRNKYIEAVKAELPLTELRESEGVNIGCGYVKPLYLQPIYQEQVAYGSKGCPFKCPLYEGEPNYKAGICPTTEEMHNDLLITHELFRPGFKQSDLDDVADAFHKVWENITELKE